MPRRKSTAVTRPNLGLYFDRPPLEVPARGLTAGNNFRILNGKLTNQGMGWEKFFAQQLNGPVTLIDNFFLRSGAQILVFGTTKDLYRYDEGDDKAYFITPRYETGTVDVTNGLPNVAGTGTSWTANVKAGDQISFTGAGETDPAAIWYEIDEVTSDTALVLTTNFAETTIVSGAYTIRKLFTSQIKDYWVTETFPKALPSNEDLWFATNLVDYGVKWNGTDTQVESLSALAFRFGWLKRYKNMMIYGNLVLDGGEARPSSIRNSAIGAPENVTTLEAAEFVVHDTVDEVSSMYSLGDSLVIYGPRTISIAQFVGPPLLFIFRAVIRGLGPVAGRLVADFGDFHEFVGPDTGYRFDGVSVQEIGQQVWREVLRRKDPNRLSLGNSHFDEERGILIWTLPFATDPALEGPKTAFLEHYVEDIGPSTPVPFSQMDWEFTATGFFERQDTLTFADITNTWAEQSFRWNDQFFTAAFPLNLAGDHNGFIYTIGTTDSFDGAAIESYVRFARQVAVDERHKGIVRRIYPFAEQMPGASDYDLGVILWTTTQMAGPLNNAGQFLYDLTHEGSRFVSPRQVARFYEIEFATTGVGHVWFLQGYDTDILPAGER